MENTKYQYYTMRVETKQEYTIQLINILTPLIYEGINSIYTEAVSISLPENILKNFQYLCLLDQNGVIRL